MKRSKNEITIFNNGQYEKEVICAKKWMRLIYENPVTSAPLLFFAKRKVISHLYGLYCRTSFSARKIPNFIKEYNVDMTGCKGDYKNFTEFFTREKNDVVFPSDSYLLGSPCEGQVSVYNNIDSEKLITVKGEFYSLIELFCDEELAKTYAGGSMLYSTKLTTVQGDGKI